MRLVRKTTRSAQNAPPCARAAINPVYSCDQHDLTLRLLNSPLSTRTSSLPIVAPAPAALGAHAQTSLPNSCAAPPLLLCSPPARPSSHVPTHTFPLRKYPGYAAAIIPNLQYAPFIPAVPARPHSTAPGERYFPTIIRLVPSPSRMENMRARAHTHTHKYTHTHKDRHTRLSCAATHKEGLAATR